MFRFLIAPFQRSATAATVSLVPVDPARLEFERLFRDDLAAQSLIIAQVRAKSRSADPAHA